MTRAEQRIEFELVIGEVDMILGDVEESEEFSDLMMNAWVRSQDNEMMEQEMDKGPCGGEEAGTVGESAFYWARAAEADR